MATYKFWNSELAANSDLDGATCTAAELTALEASDNVSLSTYLELDSFVQATAVARMVLQESHIETNLRFENVS
jgi:hypothetical protein